MVIQLTNIVAGFALAAPKLKKFGAAAGTVEDAHAKLAPYLGTLGVIELVLGAAALIERLSIAHYGFGGFGSSFPQAAVAILMGLLLAPHLFGRFPAVRNFISGTLVTRAEWIGILGIAIGLGSLLFGCMAPFCFPVGF
ncbi:MAG: hypothetical protein A3C93_01655 [Candidatus Lloydbacteria bacterium RIFCSPHIGHO2_02_FULL_54_17]|uniref:Uncharacterized protein n=1 Tax=Candidatus Lloydbacteria bacterium RIFCSPHIGHO2_02_FULL_54_17 TaxID=1798664 RepID=A0A1G2DE58_9BACT|nr:MAG: hypothetical protein A2762_02835 [Candidatus Lloydbacteria bacterium RIFCSPHIGHO2_01_FULL_54_11]OGZ11058.1 MAG: hypothetical protein A3C93_01655 [Candidatus Lloydbacteria bacterium RIFCSPHIGHO2_02_FULL_54_17]OGZ14457.1 MAG: hypothetical protein A3H76_06170 [Candidatus Lloydbacteria bacterium RIFCSPLOWO2_02_FULL_54_12]OGZ15473.1 MAG: hypothetical protein A2948_02775 [Candidatus Lloydbacteria bacterium RIFCSPLOWO2_01_FULL_54_18]